MPRVSLKNCKKCLIELTSVNRIGNLCKKCTYVVYGKNKEKTDNGYFIERRRKIKENKLELIASGEWKRDLDKDEVSHVKRLIIKGRIGCLSPLDFYKVAHYYLIISDTDTTDDLPVYEQVKYFLKVLDKKVKKVTF
jgi:hypothetical protein